mgnify:CR=1 FL=1
MAQRLTVNHAIFDTFSYQHGAEPIFDEKSTLKTFLQHGDGVLNRDAGFFFGPVEDQFVVAFESKRTDDLSRKQTMYYFDVFWADFDVIDNVHLADLVERLHEYTAGSFNAEVNSQTEIELPTYSDLIPRKNDTPDIDRQQRADNSQAEASQNQPQDEFVDANEVTIDAESSDADDEPSGFESVDTVGGVTESGRSHETQDTNNVRDQHQPTPKVQHSNHEPEPTFIAQFWEQWRRPNEQLESNIAELDRFNYAVPDAHRHLSFVSTERKINKTFDIVGGEFEYTLDTRDLEERITRLQDRRKLYWENLPTYSDELQTKAKKNYKCFKENGFFADRVDAIVGDLENEIESSIKTVQNQSAETFWKAYTDGWDDNNSGNSLIDGVSNVVGGVGTKNDPAYVSRLSAETLSDDDIDRIVDDIVREEIEGSLEAEREKIIQRLDRQIEQLERDIREQLTKTIIKNIDQIKSSEVYQRSQKEDNDRT